LDDVEPTAKRRRKNSRKCSVINSLTPNRRTPRRAPLGSPPTLLAALLAEAAMISISRRMVYGVSPATAQRGAAGDALSHSLGLKSLFYKGHTMLVFFKLPRIYLLKIRPPVQTSKAGGASNSRCFG
jgi:hypothetical protein